MGFLPVCSTQESSEEEIGEKNKEMLLYKYPCSINVLLGSSVLVTADSGGRKWRMRVSRDAMKILVRPLLKGELRLFLVKTRKLVGWRSVPLLMLHCCGIREAEDLLVMFHGVAVKGPCGRCKDTEEDMISRELADERSMRVTEMIRSRSPKIPRNNTEISDGGNEIAEEEEAEFSQELSRNNSS